MFKEQDLETYKDAIKNKIRIIVEMINDYSFVESAYFSNNSINISFNQEFDIEKQEILNTFLYGGVLKLKNKDEFVSVEAILPRLI